MRVFGVVHRVLVSATSGYLLRIAVLLLIGCHAVFSQEALDLSGRKLDPLAANPSKAVVLIFVRIDCPVSNRYAPTIQRIRAESGKDVRFYLVFPDRSTSAAQVRKYLRDFHYSISALRDPNHALVRAAHAQFTPEAAVFGRKGTLVYHGRIDDLYASFGHARPAATTHELEDAIRAVVAGRSPAQAQVAGVGCYISDLE